MPRLKLIYTHENPYHITARSNNRDWFYIEKEVLWKIFMEQFLELNKLFGFQVHVFVLMDNHYHLVASCSEGFDLGFIMQRLQGKISLKVNRITGRINHFWGGPYKASIILEEMYFSECIKYCLRNPVVAGICERVEDYGYSISSFAMNQSNLPISCHVFQKSVIHDKDDLRSWLNSATDTESYRMIQRASTRTIFKWRNRTTRSSKPF